jgi:hypothetical protein
MGESQANGLSTWKTNLKYSLEFACALHAMKNESKTLSTVAQT